jgi:hypothetical protein
MVLILLTYVLSANAPWLVNAYGVSQITHAPIMQVIGPMHRNWLIIERVDK